MKRLKLQNLILISFFSAIIAVCSWITIPSAIPFTLQTFAVFLTLGVLGEKNGFISIFIYVLLGAVGAPVFSGFKGGISAIMGATGGYITGFIAGAAVYWLIGAVLHKYKKQFSVPIMAVSFVAVLFTCYLFGTIWFSCVYSSGTGKVGFVSALTMCVLPYIIPDMIKLAAALFLIEKLVPILKRISK